MVLTYAHAKVQRQRSVGSEDRVKKRTDGRTDGRGRLRYLPHNSVGKINEIHVLTWISFIGLLDFVYSFIGFVYSSFIHVKLNSFGHGSLIHIHSLIHRFQHYRQSIQIRAKI